MVIGLIWPSRKTLVVAILDAFRRNGLVPFPCVLALFILRDFHLPKPFNGLISLDLVFVDWGIWKAVI